MALPTSTDILIVGAGPTGLACALSLVQEGCSNLLIVDSILQGQNWSRAIVMHAATLEALNRIGCADTLVEAGSKATSLYSWASGEYNMTANFESLAPYTRYPMMLIIPQSTTERVLERELRARGVEVERPYKVTELKLNEQDTHITDVVFESGQVVQARCVIGADGASSTIRRVANIGFADPDGETQSDSSSLFSHMIIADVSFTSPPPLPDAAVVSILSPENRFFIVPLSESPDNPSEQVYRIAVGIPPGLGAPPQAPSTTYIQSLVDTWGPGHINTATGASGTSTTVSRTVWASRFTTQYAIADSFFTHLPVSASGGEHGETGTKGGVILLLGDAAHLHPPVGGQGMNLGLRDAVALGPVVAAYLQSAGGVDAERPLREWAVARRERALKVIHMVKQLLWMATLPDKTIWILGIIPVNLQRSRNAFLRFVAKSSWVQTMVAWRISGLAW